MVKLKMKRHEDDTNDNSGRWMLTYSDLITLLMIFFVIMYAMSSVDSQKYTQLASSLGTALGAGEAGGRNIVSIGNGQLINTNSTKTAQGKSASGVTENDKLNNVKKELQQYIHDQNLQNLVESVDIDDKGLAVRLKNSVLFDSGKAEIKDSSKKSILAIGGILSKMSDSYIRVEGHTDNIPINNKQFSSNWELSAARATNVVKLLIQGVGISPNRISEVGYGEYRPIADNSTPEGRAKNRRVEIIVVNSKYNKIEASN